MSILNKIASIKNDPFLLILSAIFERIPFKPITLSAYHSFILANVLSKSECSHIEIRPALEADIKLISCFEDKEQVFLKRIRSGEFCIMAQINNVVVGYEWFTVTGVHIEERFNISLDIPEKALYAYDAFTNPDYRRKGVWKCIIQNSLAIMNRYQKSSIVSYIDYGNIVSESAHQKLGFVREALYISIKVFCFRHTFKLPITLKIK